jgi:GNAT superfamily N-acetyltransferase
MPVAPIIQVRQANADDAAAVAAVLFNSFVEFKPLYTIGGFSATTPGPEQVRVRMSEGPVWLALRDGVLVGTVSAVARGASVYIRGMAVMPVARGSGAGSMLLREVENWAAAEGCDRLFLSTTPFLDAAIRLYEKSGFRRTDEGPHDLFGTPLFTMVKTASQ